MGYYIHLYTDYIWFKFFIPSLFEKDKLIKLNNKKIDYNDDLLVKYVYNDYSLLNSKLIDDYELDFKIFYEEIPIIEDITEIPIEKINIIIDKAR